MLTDRRGHQIPHVVLAHGCPINSRLRITSQHNLDLQLPDRA
jgi:hypothetical protein